MSGHGSDPVQLIVEIETWLRPDRPADDQLQALPQLGLMDRADCCRARPALYAILPPTAQRNHPQTLLFCAHHYRNSRASLADLGAVSYDAAGSRVDQQPGKI